MAVVSFSVPKYRHHKGSGQAFVQIKGKRHYLGTYGSPKSKEAYSRFIAELAASPLAAPVPTPVQSPAGLTVVELADAYWQFCQGYYRKKDGTPSGWLDHIHLVLHTHRSGLYGRTPAADFGPKAFKTIRQRLVDARNSRPYVNKLMPIVTRCFKWGASEELIPASVYHGLTAVEARRAAVPRCGPGWRFRAPRAMPQIATLGVASNWPPCYPPLRISDSECARDGQIFASLT
jgi:hypothetical protein